MFGVEAKSMKRLLLAGGVTLLAALLAAAPDALAAASSAGPHALAARHAARRAAAVAGDVALTFSEYSVGTAITNQYQPQGILFGGDSPFIANDGADPTSPVLSGTPQFQGAIEGTFVDPASGAPRTVGHFSLDAGYFDEIGSTRLTWYAATGTVLGSAVNGDYGIYHFDVSAPGIARWRIEIVGVEDAGSAIDNMSFPPQPSWHPSVALGGSIMSYPDCHL